MKRLVGMARITTCPLQCCGAGATRSRNFWPEPELEPVFEVSAPAPGQIKAIPVPVYFIIIHLEHDQASDLN
jgi:hypothetical protein